MIITFIGHRSLYNNEALFETIKQILTEHVQHESRVWFYCGGYGDFDQLCAQVGRSIKEQHSNCEVVFVTPYISQSQQKKMRDFMNAKLYDAVVYPPLEKVPPRFAISKRNEWMVNEADLIIAYVQRSYGGAYKSLCYAQRKKKQIINLAEPMGDMCLEETHQKRE